MATEDTRSGDESPSTDIAGVLSAVDGYFEAANRASSGEGFEDFRARFADSCGLCLTQYENFVSAYAEGHLAQGDLYTSWEAEVQDLSGTTALVLATVDTGAILLRDADGQLLEEFPSENGITTVWTFELREDGDWVAIDARDLT